MYRTLILFLALSYTLNTNAQDSLIIADIKAFQQALNEEYKNRDESPLNQKDFNSFTSHDFFPIDLKYHVVATFVRTPNQKPFEMLTTANRTKTYEKYGEVYFELDSSVVVLNIYQSHTLRETEEYKDYLFLPFKDPTNGNETYGGGRYIDLRIPENDKMVIDFNKAYNPYCAYNTGYACPLVPKENHLDIPIYAGVKDFKKGN